MQVEDLALSARCQLDAGCPWLPLGLVCCERGAEIARSPRKLARENISIFDRRRRALGQERQHRMGGVTKKRHPASAPVMATDRGRTAPT